MVPTVSRFIRAADVADGMTPPVVAVDQAELLGSNDPQLAENKRLCYDMYRTVLQAGLADRVLEFVSPDYIQHNPNVLSGPDALAAHIRRSRPVREIKPTLELPLISIIAERDIVVFTFVRPERDAAGQSYYTSWFDQFRIADGLIIEHWDPALKSVEMRLLDPNDKVVKPG